MRTRPVSLLGMPFSHLLPEEEIIAELERVGVRFRRRCFDPVTVLYSWVTQSLSRDGSCRAAVSRIHAARSANGLPSCSTHTSGYTMARQKLPEEVVRSLALRIGGRIEDEAPESWKWHSRRALIVDGLSLSMPDTPSNQHDFPQPNSQRPGLGFPNMRVVSLNTLATGVIVSAEFGPYSGPDTSELSLFRRQWDVLQQNDVVIGDRLYSTFWNFAALRSRDVDFVFRKRHKNNATLKRALYDDFTMLSRPLRPERMSQSAYRKYPERIPLRELSCHVNHPSKRVRKITLHTSLRKIEQYPRLEIGRLYEKRWHIELDIRSLKTEMDAEILRCQSSEMVRTEYWINVLAFNLIRGFISIAAERTGTTPRQLSFVGAVQIVRSFLPHFATAEWFDQPRLFDEMIAAIGQHEVGNRPNRCEPRAVKRRPKPHKLLRESRQKARKRLLAAK